MARYIHPFDLFLPLACSVLARMTAKDFSVRAATLSDSAGVSALLLESFPTLMQSAYEPAILDPALKLMTRAQPALLSSGTYYVAVSTGGTIVGCGGWSKDHHEIAARDGVGHIRHFGTHPDWVNRGIGKAIYRRCEADARKAGVVRFECQSSLNAEGFYAACGFERVETIEIEMNQGLFLPAVHMQRSI